MSPSSRQAAPPSPASPPTYTSGGRGGRHPAPPRVIAPRRYPKRRNPQAALVATGSFDGGARRALPATTKQRLVRALPLVVISPQKHPLSVGGENEIRGRLAAWASCLSPPCLSHRPQMPRALPIDASRAENLRLTSTTVEIQVGRGSLLRVGPLPFQPKDAAFGLQVRRVLIARSRGAS